MSQRPRKGQSARANEWSSQNTDITGRTRRRRCNVSRCQHGRCRGRGGSPIVMASQRVARTRALPSLRAKRSNPYRRGKNGLLRSARNDEEEIGVDRSAKSRVEGPPGVADVRSAESPPRHGERSGDTNARPSVMASQLVARMRALPVIASQLVARTRALPSLRAKAKQSILPWKEWIASSLSLPCANASRLSQAMTAETLVRSCKTSLQ